MALRYSWGRNARRPTRLNWSPGGAWALVGVIVLATRALNVSKLRRQCYEDPALGQFGQRLSDLAGSIKVLTTCRSPLSCQFLQQNLGFLKVRSAKPFGEPPVNLGQQLTGFYSLPCCFHKRDKLIAALNSNDFASCLRAMSRARL